MFHLTDGLTGEQLVRLAEILPPLLTAGAALTASLTSLLVSLHARRKANRAQETAESATIQAREAAKEQIKFALGEIVRRRADGASVVLVSSLPPKEGGEQ